MALVYAVVVIALALFVIGLVVKALTWLLIIAVVVAVAGLLLRGRSLR